MGLSKCAEMHGLWGRNKQSSSSNSGCSPAREGSMILILAGWSYHLVSRFGCCNLGSGFGEGAVQSRLWTQLSRATRQALPCLQHRAGTARGLCQVFTQHPLAQVRGQVGGKRGLRGGQRAPTRWLDCAHLAGLAPERCRCLHPDAPRSQEQERGGNCLFLYFTL